MGSVEEKMRVCVHEAAHAIIALDTGGSARVRLMIAANGELSGVTTECPPPQRMWKTSPYFRRALISAAGELAETKYFGSAPPAGCSEWDHQRQAHYADKLGLDEASMRSDIRKRVRRAFSDERIWRQVLGVAASLFVAWDDAQASSDGITEVNEASLREVIAMVSL
jgi:hypothetical protein